MNIHENWNSILLSKSVVRGMVLLMFIPIGCDDRSDGRLVGANSSSVVHHGDGADTEEYRRQVESTKAYYEESDRQLREAARQLDVSRRQQEEAERQIGMQDAQLKRIDKIVDAAEALLERWKANTDRFEKLLLQWEKLTENMGSDVGG